uniref:NR LBD domain-containing protein n=1 Tax=Panagrolaimus davidi TaxID=227884 RepID=A0A914QZW7_9BILA
MPSDEIQRIFSPSIKAIYEQVVRPIKRLKPSEFEYLTMMGLIIWKCENVELYSNFVDKAKSELLESLHNYFINEKKLFCYAQRLTEIMEIISAIEKAIDKTNEDAVLSQLFDVFQCDIYFSKLFDE